MDDDSCTRRVRRRGSAVPAGRGPRRLFTHHTLSLDSCVCCFFVQQSSVIVFMINKIKYKVNRSPPVKNHTCFFFNSVTKPYVEQIHVCCALCVVNGPAHARWTSWMASSEAWRRRGWRHGGDVPFVPFIRSNLKGAFLS